MPSRATSPERVLTCAFCGRTSEEGLRIHSMAHKPNAAICDHCLMRMGEPAWRSGAGQNLRPPEMPPDYEYPLPGVRAPFYHRLLRVIPIERSHREGSFELTVVALEVYDESCLMSCWIQAVSDDPERRLIQPLAWVTFALSDDQGTVYSNGEGHSRGYRLSTTANGAGYYLGRIVYDFAPTLNPAARALNITVAELLWEHVENDQRGRQPVDEIVGAEGVPWSFTVDLTASTKQE